MKTEISYTKGNWHVLLGNYTHAATINTDCMNRICAIEASLPNNGHAKEYRANAYLIAAAPDMLNALNNIIEKLSPHIHKLGVKKGFSEILALEEGRQAIRKATEFQTW